LEANINWEEVLNALQTTHTLTIRKICQYLKVNRWWVSKYICPLLEENKIYLPNGMANKKLANWVEKASIALNRSDLKESCWFKNEDFYNLLRNSVTEVSRQTIQVPTELFIDDDQKDEFKRQYDEYSEQIGIILQYDRFDEKKVSELNKITNKRKALWLTLVTDEKKLIYNEGIGLYNKRTATERTVVKPDFDIVDKLLSWVSPSDIKDYGDSDEQIYRMFFNEGYYRIDLQINDSDKGKKVYYLEDTEKIPYHYVNQYIPYQYDKWIKNQATLAPKI